MDKSLRTPAVIFHLPCLRGPRNTNFKYDDKRQSYLSSVFDIFAKDLSPRGRRWANDVKTLLVLSLLDASQQTRLSEVDLSKIAKGKPSKVRGSVKKQSSYASPKCFQCKCIDVHRRERGTDSSTR